jgi:hypothetical protein
MLDQDKIYLEGFAQDINTQTKKQKCMTRKNTNEFKY